ncbi:MAG: serine hydrolase [Oscillospiraceae bacterium]|nr:serine hydrolase [Oscillospiraceae bacterium]
MKYRLNQLVVFLLLAVILTSHVTISASAAVVGGQEITSRGACVIDFDTGLVLFGYNEDTLMAPASMIKLVAAYVIFDAIEAGEISLETVTYISPIVSQLSNNLAYSNVPLPRGTAITIGTLLDLVLVASACGATAALGEALCGTEWAFMMRMNDKLASLGIEGVFYDSYGVSEYNRISPRGIALLARALIRDYPQILEISTKASVTFNDKEYKNTNMLLGDYWGIDGLKTGFTDAAGYCFTGTAQRDARRVISVTMGSNENSRFEDSKILLDYGFAVASDVVSDYNARPSTSKLILNGEELPLYAYLIGGSHYFRLRDIAILLNGTGNQFDIFWHHELKIVSLSTGIGYSDEDQNLIKLDSIARKGTPTPASILLDGEEKEMDVYMIDASNYFRLRDLGSLFGFEVDWIEESRTVIIDTMELVVDDGNELDEIDETADNDESIEPYDWDDSEEIIDGETETNEQTPNGNEAGKGLDENNIETD